MYQAAIDKIAARVKSLEEMTHTVDEIFLFRVAANVGEGQHDDGEARWGQPAAPTPEKSRSSCYSARA